MKVGSYTKTFGTTLPKNYLDCATYMTGQWVFPRERWRSDVHGTRQEFDWANSERHKKQRLTL